MGKSNIPNPHLEEELPLLVARLYNRLWLPIVIMKKSRRSFERHTNAMQLSAQVSFTILALVQGSVVYVVYQTRWIILQQRTSQCIVW